MSENENYNDIDFEYNITNIKDKTDNYEEDELIEKLDLLEKKWCENYDNLSIIEIIKKCLNKFKLNENYTKEELENAFDTVNYNILLSKLDHYGIRDTLLTWIASYLSNRK